MELTHAEAGEALHALRRLKKDNYRKLRLHERDPEKKQKYSERITLIDGAVAKIRPYRTPEGGREEQREHQSA